MEVLEMNNKALDYTALTLAIIGAINWGLIGFFSFDLVAFIFGNLTWISRIIYASGTFGGRILNRKKTALLYQAVPLFTMTFIHIPFFTSTKPIMHFTMSIS